MQLPFYMGLGGREKKGRKGETSIFIYYFSWGRKWKHLKVDIESWLLFLATFTLTGVVFALLLISRQVSITSVKKESSVLNQVHCHVGVSGWFVCYLVDSNKIGTSWVKGKSPPGSPPRKEATAVTFVSLSPERRFKSGVAKA